MQHQLSINTQPNNMFSPRFSPYNIAGLRNNSQPTITDSKKNSIIQSHDIPENHTSQVQLENSKNSADFFQWNSFNLGYLNSSGIESFNNSNNHQQQVQHDLLSSILFKQNFYSGNNLLLNSNTFKNFGSIFSPKNSLLPSNISASNTSALSSGYNTFDENNSQLANDQNKQAYSSDSASSDQNSNTENNIENKKNLGSLAHIMNWVKSTPTTENLIDLTVRLLFSVIKWAKRNRNLNLLSESDQNILISDNLSQLFILQMAESKTTLNECKKYFLF